MSRTVIYESQGEEIVIDEDVHFYLLADIITMTPEVARQIAGKLSAWAMRQELTRRSGR